MESIKNLFVEQTLDTRIEAALPLLARLAAPVVTSESADMQELSEFQDWADELTNTQSQDRGAQARMQELMAEPLPAGTDGINAIEQLSDMVDDAALLDRVQTIADSDPDADVFQDAEVQRILAQHGFDAPAQPAVSEPNAAADDIDAAVQTTQEDLGADGVMINHLAIPAVQWHPGAPLVR